MRRAEREEDFEIPAARHDRDEHGGRPRIRVRLRGFSEQRIAAEARTKLEKIAADLRHESEKATKDREKLRRERDAARGERDVAQRERDAAVTERDAAAKRLQQIEVDRAAARR